ncbi:hypothetical protein VHEMI00884 [[Torrubiella] hemipterigena]|uniref:AB hydrolase-1 domain-containing protein n=1 Tax=[Torrubiella] hemipterigena TaxID=1531966 RepID=A0A0A1T3S1_9HYPO|nr:hypothetical protein VHEMI00884 [[Torrubiella] hemipterigena]
MEQAQDIHKFEIANFEFQNGTVLPSVQLSYLDINADQAKTALVVTCFRGRLHTTLNFARGALRNHRIIVVALFGNSESSSPSNTAGFPASLDYRDCVRAQHALLTSHLGINTIDIAVGFSMGGQCVYHWLCMYPDMVGKASIICSSARTSKHNFQFLEGPKFALTESIDYAKDQTSSKTVRGLRAFGKAYSAWLTSPEWFDQELYKTQGYTSLEAWDEVVAGTNYAGWHPEDLLVKLGMWQKSDITIHGTVQNSSLETVLGDIKAPVLLMPCQTDQYFRWEASEREAAQMKHAVLKVIPSVWGHLAGAGVDSEDRNWLDSTLSEFLSENV